MKRIKLVLLLLSVFILTGCANTLKCEIKTNNYESKVKVTYKDDKPTKYVFKDKMLFSPTSADAELYYHSKYEEYNTLISEKHARLHNRAKDVSMEIKYDFTTDTSGQEGKLLISRNDTKGTAIKKIEDLGYKCK